MTEKALHNSELRYRRLFETARDGILILDGATGQINDANPAFLEMAGYSRDEVLGQRLFDLGLFQDAPAAAGFWQALKLKGDAVEEKLSLLVKSGQLVKVEVVGTLDAEEDREVVQLQFYDVSARVSAEEKLQESEAKLAKVQQIARLGSWEFDLSHPDDPAVRPLSWSREVFRIFGYEPGQFEVSRENFLKAVHPDDRELVQSAVADSIRRRQPYNVEHRIVLPDGSERIVHERAELVFDELTGQPLKMVGTVQDITEAKHKEASLHHSNTLLKAITESTTDAIFAKDGQGRYLMLNSAGTDIVGCSAKEALGKTDAELFPLEAADNFNHSDRLIMERGVAQTHEQYLCIGDVSRTYLTTKGPLYGPDGEVVGVVGIARDISERKQAEEALRRSEARFRTLVQSSWDVFYLVDAEGTITYESPAVTRVLGYQPEEMMGHNVMEFVHPDDIEMLQKKRSALLAEPEGFLNVVLRVCHKDGAWRWIECFEVNLMDHPDIGAIAVNYRDITDRMAAEAERDRFFTLSLDMMGIVGQDGCFKRVNPAFTDTLGFTEAELMAQPFRDWVHPDDREKTQAAAENLRHGIPLTDLVNRYPTKDGSWRWLEWRSVAVSEEGLIYAAARDVTERKEAEAALRRMRDELEIRVQERTAELEKVSAETRTRARQQEAVAELGQRALADVDMETLLSGATALVTATLDVEISSLLELMPDGQTLRMCASTGWKGDTSNHFVSATSSSMAGYVLEHEAPTIVTDLPNEIRFTPSSRLLEEGIVSGVTVIVPGYDRPFGTLGAHTTKQRHFTLEDVHFLQAMANVLAAAIERHRVDTEVRQLNVRLEQTNEQLQVENIERHIALDALREVTAGLEQAKEEAERARETAEVANQAKSEFLSRMSHELRTPLNAILGFAQILEMRSVLAPNKDQESVQQILKAGRHLLALINEVLDIARIEAGRLSLSPESLAVNLTVREVLDVMVPLAQARQIRFVNGVQDDGGALQVLADQQRLKQVLLNFLSNAVKYNREGGEVVVSCQALPGSPVSYEGIHCMGRLRILVRDTGYGLTADQIARLFVPFERLEANQKQIEGTGIGLSLCKRLVEAMHGQVGVESEVGEGSTFWLELPLVPTSLGPGDYGGSDAGAAGGVGDEADSGELENPADSQPSPRTVLYIEDNLSNLQLIEWLLSDFGERVQLLPAMQGRIGLELAALHKPDLVLLDVNLPDIMGDVVLEQLKANPLTEGIPVVVLSADATTRQIERLLQGGAIHYLTKPLDMGQLLRILTEILEIR